MSSTMKISLLALISTVAAVPHYSHGQFHNRAANEAKPYPTGGWESYNSTAVPAATGTGSDGKSTTINLTSTSTQHVYSTVHIKPSPAAANVDNVPAGTGQCGPATITVTASEVVTVTVGEGADAPTSSAVTVESMSNYASGAPAGPAGPETPAAVESSMVVSSTMPAAQYPAVTPAEKSMTPAVVTPEASATSKAVESVYMPSMAHKPAESSAAPSPTPSPSTGNTYTGTKRGLAYNEAALCKTFGSKFGFGYNWGQVENNDIGTSFIPMMHSPDKSTAAEWLANVDKAASKGSKAVMGFNECDQAQQCNLSPEAACSAWKQYMNPVKAAHPELTIIGPSVTNGPAPMGLDWLSRFHQTCPDATIDATNIHFYDQYDSDVFNRFKSQVEKAAQIYGKPCWITEFGLNPGTATEEQAASFLKEAMAYLDSSDNVQGYSWFMVGNGENQLNSGDGLSAVGKVYAGAA
ncbi:hypothetical protein EJ02DRAFT_164917 [Clathrospora elynae]|uniref:Asl1-like glycosyl hydrolase catalytic domain-containing protein n=1 Tax=Clathrospora elynae TaxID=706981 RepID=A0A6A5SPB7_9PLEO|nr:hypothetical protein EJ02DRAFT_164917 [Clathrospora elynae]